MIDDGEMLAYMHWVLVNPEYQGLHIGSGLIERVKEKYADYVFLEVMPEESKNASFYQHHGFTLMEDGRALQIVRPS
ncbi:Acetyltransferase [Bifidobacterium pseudolongum subsp. globosum]|uniref:Acetyltransferase n=1 Tax=Bifidobacterium pseudolongum subsp. globosum TaxID=1690 RepID=A0A2N3QXB9_9BIFI|nr:GNAT family N-acetyltransferase [Bifidobacterium pseudolongum]PKU97338.1 Acetyltransferase [Bifidobacterium pseudolongum subsp. globosum]PKV06052.1 Acetyltransferase [Bifidobacterium pseudolongum subsp. globosum]RYQ75310.1 Acetyltransferase [Bifidobacterium pseudolongum subsp. globosum]RYQ76736.1 Acetyltransferase [Bifidobacterium pseudolongum subsp. globosum]